jgi:protein O-GlcNAc transferase
MKKSRAPQTKASKAERLFFAEAAYADSMVRSAFGDHQASLSCLKQALALKPDYAPAILSMGSVEYQRGRSAQGRKLFRSLLSLPGNTPDLCQIVDEAGTFLIQFGAYKDGLELYRAAVERFPAAAALHSGLACCAGHEGAHDEAVAAAERALRLEPDNQEFVNDLGWCLFEAGRLEEARQKLEQAVSMDPSDELARENLRFCKATIAQPRKKTRRSRGVAVNIQTETSGA